MKLAYRITTPILAIGAIVMGVMLKLFQFVLGGIEETIDSLLTIAEAFGVATTYEYSAYELIELLASGMSTTTEDSETLLELLAPLIPQLIAFFVFLAFTLLTFVVIAGLAAFNKSKKSVIITSVVGIILTFVCIGLSNSAFAVITSGEISISDLIALLMPDSTLMQLASLVVSISSATLSAGFYALFGMFLLIILWSIFADWLIKNPIEKKRKSYKRNSLMKKVDMYKSSKKARELVNEKK